ncbi:SAM-dependent methyltransferase [Sulfurimonas gotlandica GD1]|uniref:SAM-dependent methyltransferase n=1 Tax=Sulfurimonas gotlandica (strain DSM 19862 / JCM 16533 / GD1) TaxID=929558 RepID=B6BKE5_SULGG|nr:class I SAM-dependent methyltransferase [Sulfurimonas gotlandica]EDZ62407.1 Methyltransferase domain family protein [Sulfurimonas gotlandica GD1]EHP29000.1 SAM-dependent methyltransferase [Sulfurimonas gotlandica GD1]
MEVRIDRDTLLELTDATKERNIYTHPLFLARDIFWQRLEYAFKYLKKYTKPTDKILDFGGGSGVFCKTLASYYDDVSIIDLDVDEAKNIISHYDINNVTLINEDINKYKMDGKYDVIIATDVLEHFYDLEAPINFFNKFLKKDGILLVTLPTENWVYELGRKIVNKQKPEDHYHSSNHVINFLKKSNFKEIEKRFIPKYIVPIPLFEVAIFTFEEL